MAGEPIAFMSYVRSDDQHENGRLSHFRERLSGEVRMQTGETFEIFQDRNDIAWGEQWLQRIEGSLDTVTFLIPVITPAFFKSPACRAELERFLKREEALGRTDLILPLYYVECTLLNDDAKREEDSLATLIADRQFVDWRELRFESLSSPVVGKRLASMARQIVDALERGQTAPARPAGDGHSDLMGDDARADDAERGREEEEAVKTSERAHRPEPKTEVPTLVVDALHRGDFTTVTEALETARPGARILVRPGLYREGVVIDKPVEIIGDGEQADIVIEASGKPVVHFKSSMGRIANLTLRQTGGGKWFGVDIAQGRLDLEECDISNQSLACVAIHGGADPRLRRNRFHHGAQSGVYIYESGLGTLEENEIFANGLAGVEIKEGGDPTLRRNRIYGNKQTGVHVYENGRGTLEENEIFANALAGITIRKGSNPILRRNRIHDGKQGGVLVEDNGLGTLEENEIFANAYAGVEIRGEGSPTLFRNRIFENNQQAIWLQSDGGGIFEANDLRNNRKGAWRIDRGAESSMKRRDNIE